jgi:putative DNA primase/helicase
VNVTRPAHKSEAAEVAKALGGARRAGSGWQCHCPAHDDRDPSLSVRDTADGKLLAHCHAGCRQEEIIDALRSRKLWGPLSARPCAGRQSGDVRDGHERVEAALATWHAAVPAEGTLVETYLASRGLRLPLSDVLRFHAGLRHPSGDVWPGMIGLVTRPDGAFQAIHRTYLARDGRAKAPVEPTRMMLGPCRGGVVRLAPAGEVLMLGEGVESSLAGMQASGHPAWAALSTSGLRALDLPSEVREVIVLADGDDAGEAAAKDCALRWTRQALRVRIARPPRGLDFNDVLMGRVAQIKRGAQ